MTYCAAISDIRFSNQLQLNDYVRRLKEKLNLPTPTLKLTNYPGKMYLKAPEITNTDLVHHGSSQIACRDFWCNLDCMLSIWTLFSRLVYERLHSETKNQTRVIFNPSTCKDEEEFKMNTGSRFLILIELIFF